MRLQDVNISIAKFGPIRVQDFPSARRFDNLISGFDRRALTPFIPRFDQFPRYVSVHHVDHGGFKLAQASWQPGG